MKNNNIKENEIKNEVDGNMNTELHNLVNEETKKTEKSCIKGILTNVLDQTLLTATSAVLVILFEQILKLFGYRFVQGTGAIILAAGIIYFILNCIYAPIMEKSKIKRTIANKVLNVN